MNFRVIFELDGSGLRMNRYEPIHLDALLAWCLAPMQSTRRGLGREDEPADIQLPLLRETIGGVKVWRASALFVAGSQAETRRFWRKRFRVSHVQWTHGSPNLQNGVYREYNQPQDLMLVTRLYAYAAGSRKRTLKTLRKQLGALGKKRAHGLGRIVSIDAEEIEEDRSWVWQGMAMRWLPAPGRPRLVRPSPPYWSNVGRVSCCEVGEEFEIVEAAR